MRILFTLFTPPFSQTNSTYIDFRTCSEEQYLNYMDWNGSLRKNLAELDGCEVKFVSMSLKNKVFSIFKHGYESIFFPLNRKPNLIRRIKKVYDISELDSDALFSWVKRYNPDVIHVIGSGHRLAKRIVKDNSLNRKVCLWERVELTSKKIKSSEYFLSRNIVMPTEFAAKELRKIYPEKNIYHLPLGVDLEIYKNSTEYRKDFDVISVGGLSKRKQINVVRDIVVKNNLSWIHAGEMIEGKPFFSSLEDILYFRKFRKYLLLSRKREAKFYKHKSGFFSDKEMVELYSRSKILIHPSLAEGAPRAVQEAIACGTPVVVLKDTVPYITNSFSRSCYSHDEFDEVVMELLNNEEKRKNLAIMGRKWLEENHSSTHLCKSVEKINNEIYMSAK